MSSKRPANSLRIRIQCPRAGHYAFAALLCLVSLAAGAFAQGAPSKLADFAGTWKAEFKKHPWLVLTLQQDKGAVTGTLTHSTYLSADNEGDITDVGEEMSNATIEKATLDGNVLHILTKDEDGDEDRYNFSLTGADTADLQPVSTDGAPVPKAFKLKRAAVPHK